MKNQKSRLAAILISGAVMLSVSAPAMAHPSGDGQDQVAMAGDGMMMVGDGMMIPAMMMSGGQMAMAGSGMTMVGDDDMAAAMMSEGQMPMMMGSRS